jgi:hypothetical protein
VFADGFDVDGFDEVAVSEFEVPDFDGAAVSDFDDAAEGDFVDDVDSDVLPDDDSEDFALSLLLDPVTDLTVFAAAEVTFLTGLLSACAMPVAKPSRRKPTISPTTRSSRRARCRSAGVRGSVATSTGVSDAVLVMAMRSPPWSPFDGWLLSRAQRNARSARSQRVSAQGPDRPNENS